MFGLTGMNVLKAEKNEPFEGSMSAVEALSAADGKKTSGATLY